MFCDLVEDFLWIGHNSLTNRSKKHFEVISLSVVHGSGARYTQQGFTLRKRSIAAVTESALKLGCLKKILLLLMLKYLLDIGSEFFQVALQVFQVLGKPL